MLFGFSTKVQLDGRKQGICRKIKGGHTDAQSAEPLQPAGCAREPIGMGW